MEVLHNIKCVIVGSKGVGKTSLLNTFVSGPQSPEPVFETYNGIKVQIEECGEMYQLQLWDTNSADYNKLIRKVQYENCDVVLICFSVMDRESFKSAKKKWLPEVLKCCPSTPYLLVGTKNDLRHDKVSLLRAEALNLKPMTVDECAKWSETINAVKYLECSAVSGDGVKEVFREAIKTHINPPKLKESSCRIL